MIYRVAKSSEEVREWSKRTVRLAKSGSDIEELRYEVGKIKLPEANGEQTFLYVIPKSDTSYAFMLYTHHTPFDNAGVQILLDNFLARLSNYIANPSLASTETLPWGTEYKNLPPPTSAILNEPREGPLHAQAVGMILNSLKLQLRGIGFKRRDFGLGYTRYFHTEFSVDETTRFVQAVRALGGTVNQFAHAGLCVLSYLDNPTTENTPEDAAYVCFGLENSRFRLLPEHQKYPGYALGISCLAVPASIISSAAPKGEKVQLIEAAKAVKEEYKAFKANPSLMGGQPQASEIFFGVIKQNPRPPPNENLGFGFSGDGIAEKYLSHTYNAPDGKVFTTLEDYFTSVDMTGPGSFFRANTWRGRLRLCVDANELAVPPDVAQGYVDKWAELLKLLL